MMRRANLNWFMLLVGTLLFVSSSGCATIRGLDDGAWASDYDTAEKRVARCQLPMLIYYSDKIPTAHNPSMDWENDPAIKPLLADYVCCRLYRQSAFDRRYVAQFGVSRAPAVMVARSDGTHHAQEGVRTADQFIQFLAKAGSPGQISVMDPHIVRRAQYEWMDNVSTARHLARENGKLMLVAYVKQYSRDWAHVNKLLKHHVVYRHLRDAIMCRVYVSSWSSDVHISEFGAVTLPAIVIESPDGRHEVMQQPTDYEEIAAFAASMLQPDRRVSSGVDITQPSQSSH